MASNLDNVKKALKRRMQGVVVSDKMTQTLTVKVTRQIKHPLYKKYIKRTTKLHVHDAEGQGRLNDTVLIEETRPISKTKRWRLVEVVARAE